MTDETTESALAAPAGLTSTATPESITADPSVQASMARALVEGGHWTQEQADAALAAEGAAEGAGAGND